MQETNRTEYKRELNDRFERTVVSFLNYAGGGEILIGMDDNGAAIGVEDADATQLKIVDRIRINIRPQTLGLFDVVLTRINRKDVIRVIVSCGQQRPYYIRKMGMPELGCFIRVGSSVQPMSEQMIEELLTKRQQVTLQSMKSPRQNLTFKQLCIYYEEKNSNRRNNSSKALTSGRATAITTMPRTCSRTITGFPSKWRRMRGRTRWICLKRANTATVV